MAEQEMRSRAKTIDMNQEMNTHEEKDEFIEILRRQHIKYKEKIKDLEDNNADFYKTIKKQQEVLENMEKSLDTQKVGFKKEQRELRARKNGEIRKIKAMLLKERDLRTELENKMGVSKELSNNHLSINATTSDLTSAVELQSLRRDNSNLEEQVESMAKELDEFKKITSQLRETQQAGTQAKELEDEYWRKMEEGYKLRLAEKEEELRIVREELLEASSVVTGINELAGGIEGTKKLLEQLSNSESKIIGLNAEANKLRNNLNDQQMRLKVAQAERDRLESLLGGVTWECADLKRQMEDNKKECEDTKTYMKNELDEALKQTRQSVQWLCVEKDKFQNTIRKLEEEKKADIATLVRTHQLEKAAELETLVRKHQLEKAHLSAELETYRKEKEWSVISKIATINSVASELERLRNSLAC